MNIDMLALKRADPMAQPCTNIWRVEPKYSDPRTLIDNWRENRAKTEHEKRPEHEKYLLPEKPASQLQESQWMHNKKHLKRVYLPTGYADKLIKDARTTPYITYIGCHNDEDYPCDEGAECNPIWSSKLPAWHMTNLSNYAPTEEEQQKRVGSEILSGAVAEMEKRPAFPYPKRWIYRDPQNYGLLSSKKAQWANQLRMKEKGSQMRSIYTTSYTPKYIESKPFTVPDRVLHQRINDSLCPFRGRQNGLYRSLQTSAQMEKRYLLASQHMDYRDYAGL